MKFGFSVSLGELGVLEKTMLGRFHEGILHNCPHDAYLGAASCCPQLIPRDFLSQCVQMEVFKISKGIQTYNLLLEMGGPMCA